MAGVLDDGIISEQTHERFAKVFTPKVQGALNLHEATKDLNLDYFVLYSSIASSMGSPGQSNYAAANSFLDQLARYRKQNNLVATSINWGPWATGGMAAALTQQHARKGMLAFNEVEGIKAIVHALEQSSPNIQAAEMNWDTVSKQTTKVPAWLESLVTKTHVQNDYLITLLEQTDKENREAVLKTELSRLIKETLGLIEVKEELGFFDMGMDSLMAVELRNRIQAAIGSEYSLSNTLLFEQGNLDALAHHLKQEILYEVFEQSKVAQIIHFTKAVGADEPIAIIGMYCGFPGGANSPDKFWELLTQGYDGISEVPKDRWDIDDYYDPDIDAPGKINTRLGGFLKEDVSLFDAAFFNISPIEAERMDPQQRILLETTWYALESAGIKPESLKATQTGVYLGICASDYATLQTKYQNETDINAYMGTGNALSVAAGRIAYTLGFTRPSIFRRYGMFFFFGCRAFSLPRS